VFEAASRIDDWGTRPNGSLLSRAIDELCLAWACNNRLDLVSDCRASDAGEKIDEAIDRLRRAGYADYTVRGLIIRARALIAMPIDPESDQDQAEKDIAEAELECELGCMSLLEVDTLIERVCLEITKGNIPTAIEKLFRADEVARQIGFGRWRPRLLDLANQLNVQLPGREQQDR
jgi:hypothetical protein